MYCCVCLTESTECISIFDETGIKWKIAKVIHQHLWFEPHATDDLLSYICHACWVTLTHFHVFYQQAEKAHAEYRLRKETLVSKLETDEDIPDNALDEDHIKEVDVATILGKHSVKKNPLDEWSGVDCSSDEYEPSEKPENESCSEDENVKKATKPTEKKGKDTELKIRKRKDSKITEDVEPIRKKPTRFHIDYVHAEQMIQKHIPMACNLCAYVGKTFADIKSHFRDSHPQIIPYVTCCDKQFTKRFYVAKHALKHEDPNHFRSLLGRHWTTVDSVPLICGRPYKCYQVLSEEVRRQLEPGVAEAHRVRKGRNRYSKVVAVEGRSYRIVVSRQGEVTIQLR